MSHPWDERVIATYEHGKQYCSLWMSHTPALEAAIWLGDVCDTRVRVGKLMKPYTGRSWYAMELP